MKSILGDRPSVIAITLMHLTDARLIQHVRSISDNPRHVNASDRRILLREIARRFEIESETKK